MSDTPRYSVLIEWSEIDQTYVVILPKWADQFASGKTYEEAASRRRNALEHMKRPLHAGGMRSNIR